MLIWFTFVVKREDEDDEEIESFGDELLLLLFKLSALDLIEWFVLLNDDVDEVDDAEVEFVAEESPVFEFFN